MRTKVILAALLLALACTGLLPAQTDSSPTPDQVTIANTNAAVAPAPPTSDTPSLAAAPNPAPAITADQNPANAAWQTLAALLAITSLGGFLLYQCGLTRAKNCGHTSTLLLLGALFALIGYWVGGFSVQTGGVGDAHAALATPFTAGERGVLDHELGLTLDGHHWGFMGNSGFFLITEDSARNGAALLFLAQAALLSIAITAALGAALERGRLPAMVVASFVFGALIYPLLANWVWGGGWLAQLGREYGLGHGVVDLAGAGVVHLTAGTLALALALNLGPRHGRFGPNRSVRAIPGHHVPFVVLGTALLLITWTATNTLAAVATDPQPEASGGTAALAAVNSLLAGSGGLAVSFLLGAWLRRLPGPTWLCRGLLGGVVACAGCGSLIDPWAAFIIGGAAGLLVQGTVVALEKLRVDDPTGAISIHGAGGVWGLLATGLFANGTAGRGINDVADPVRGLFFGGGWHQLTAQAIGGVTGFIVVFVLGSATLLLLQKILGNRVTAAVEAEGLDLPETGALGYQYDVEPDDSR